MPASTSIMNAADVERDKKFFTVAEANQRLPLVRRIVEDIVHLFGDVQDRQKRLAELSLHGPNGPRQPSVYSEELEQMENEIRADIGRLEGFAHELAELGVELKDPSVGLVDFPTSVDGREAYLCWKLGEPEIGFWHDLEAGFAGRRHVADLLPKTRYESSRVAVK